LRRLLPWTFARLVVYFSVILMAPEEKVAAMEIDAA
jgi:hypothetical protein